MSLLKLVNNIPFMVRFQSFISIRSFASNPFSNFLESAEEEPVFLEETPEYIEQKRNKSRLNPAHRNILMNKLPYDESLTWYHNTLRYKRRILGRYGMEALGNVPAGIAWPTPEEVEDAKEYERVAFPLTLQERWQKIKEEHKKQEEAIMASQAEIDRKMSQMKQMIFKVEERVAKRTKEVEEAKKIQEKRLKDIRRQLGATGRVTSEKIHEMLAKMEKEDKKKRKAAKKERVLERQKKFLAKSMQLENDDNVKASEEKAPKSGEGSPSEESTETLQK